MAAVPVTLAVMIYPKNKTDAPYPATIVGYAWVTGLQPGGGPVIPPSPDAPHPSHPIVLPGDPEWGQDLKPTHPIMLPGMPGWPSDPPPEIPTTPSEPKPPPADGGWGWSPTYGWGYFPGPNQAGPKRK